MSTIIQGGNIIAAITGGVFYTASSVFGLTRSQMLLVTPALILAIYLMNQDLVSDPIDSSGSDWPLFVSRIPDTTDVKTDCVAIYDTTGLKDGRLMIGPVIEHYGLQIKIRSNDHNDGWAKLEAIMIELDSIHNELVTADAEEFQIYNVKRVGSIIPLGTEEGTRGRQLFTANFLVTLKRVV